MEPVESFGKLLRRFRESRALTLRALSEATEIDYSLLARFERDERLPTSRAQVARLIAHLAVSSPEGDRLLVAAGFAPLWFDRIDPGDPTLQAVVRALTASVPGARVDAFRQGVQALATLF